MSDRGVQCWYCCKPAHHVGGDQVYPHRPGLHHKKFWKCLSCGAYVGCHSPRPQNGYVDDLPLGRLANKELRLKKTSAHEMFDPIWKDKHMTRREAYVWLAGKMGLPLSRCHIGDFDESMCDKAIKVCVDWWTDHLPRTPPD